MAASSSHNTDAPILRLNIVENLKFFLATKLSGLSSVKMSLSAPSE